MSHHSSQQQGFSHNKFVRSKTTTNQSKFLIKAAGNQLFASDTSITIDKFPI
ncbi:hypothetical protein [Scytonema sp. NUACC26]|uniref:hypothetical protein n=1 Tax=Scytonema sp. NUACC26 TaxID=3140176 RepID=UPI0038B3EAA5